MTDERRTSPRHPVSLAGELETAEGKSAIAITRDVSAGGLLLFTRFHLEPGASVKLTVIHDNEHVVITGTVLREHVVEPEESTLWRTKVAVAVDSTNPVLAKIFQALAAQS